MKNESLNIGEKRIMQYAFDFLLSNIDGETENELMLTTDIIRDRIVKIKSKLNIDN